MDISLFILVAMTLGSCFFTLCAIGVFILAIRMIIQEQERQERRNYILTHGSEIEKQTVLLEQQNEQQVNT